MQKNKDFYHQSLRQLISEMEKVYHAFKDETDRIGSDWKDRRKIEFFNRQIQPRRDDLKNALTDLQMIAQQLKVIDDTLKRY